MRGNWETLQPWVASLLCLSGAALLFAGLYTPPIGIIDASVLVAYGEICSFVGAIAGIDYHYRKGGGGTDSCA